MRKGQQPRAKVGFFCPLVATRASSSSSVHPSFILFYFFPFKRNLPNLKVSRVLKINGHDAQTLNYINYSNPNLLGIIIHHLSAFLVLFSLQEIHEVAVIINKFLPSPTLDCFSALDVLIVYSLNRCVHVTAGDPGHSEALTKPQRSG